MGLVQLQLPLHVLMLDAGGPLDHHLSETLRELGHAVTMCTTIAGLVEAAMRDGSRLDLILIGAAHPEQLRDAARYAHWYAPRATLIALDDDQASTLALPFPIHVATVLQLPVAS